MSVAVLGNTVAALGVFDACTSTTLALTLPACSATPVAAIAGVAAPPQLVFLSSPTSVLRNGDAVNIYALSGACSQPLLLSAVGSAVVWQPLTAQPAELVWQLLAENAGSALGSVIAPLAPFRLRHTASGLSVIVSPATGQLLLSVAPSSVVCTVGGGAPPLVNAALFYLAAPYAAMPATTWTSPQWLNTWFPFWYRPAAGWWPAHWNPPRPPVQNPCWLPPSQRPAYCFSPAGACQSSNPPPWCAPGSDLDAHGCKPSAGFSWCPWLSPPRCCQPWNSPRPVGPPLIGPGGLPPRPLSPLVGPGGLPPRPVGPPLVGPGGLPPRPLSPRLSRSR